MNESSPQRALIVGCGYLGKPVAQQWLAAGGAVHVMTRSVERAASFREQGFFPLVADVTQPATLAALRELPPLDVILYAVGFDRSAGKSIHEVYGDGFRAALQSLPRRGRLIYISSTGVYGDQAGDWIDESTACHPVRENGQACLAAELWLQTAPYWRDRSVILRLAGLYGPGRLPYREALRTGEPIPAPADGYLNLIHRDDAAAAVLAADRWLASRVLAATAATTPTTSPNSPAEAHDSPTTADRPAVFLISDGEPPLRRDYYAEMARLLGGPAPRFSSPPAESSSALRAAANKRISNRRAVATLGLVFRYPNYREGLRAALFNP